jgi:hypothetical protein
LIDVGFASADSQSLRRLEVETVACTSPQRSWHIHLADSCAQTGQTSSNYSNALTNTRISRIEQARFPQIFFYPSPISALNRESSIHLL